MHRWGRPAVAPAGDLEGTLALSGGSIVDMDPTILVQQGGILKASKGPALARARRASAAVVLFLLGAFFACGPVAPPGMGPQPPARRPAERALLQPQAVPAALGSDSDSSGSSGGGSGSGRPRISAFVNLTSVAEFDRPGLSDPTVVFYRGYYLVAFTRNAVNWVQLAASRGGRRWVLTDLRLERFQWASLFVHRGRLFVIGPEGDLWSRRRKGIPNDLQLAEVEFEGPGRVREVSRAFLTRGMGVHILNNVPAVVNDTVYFPIMVAPASTRWDPLRVLRYAAAINTSLDQGMHAVAVGAGGAQAHVGPLDWDAGVLGVEVGPGHRLGPNAFVRLEQASANLTVYARVVAVEAGTLWVVPQKWHADCATEQADWACKSSLAAERGELRLGLEGWAVWPDSPIFQEFLLAVMQHSTPTTPASSDSSASSNFSPSNSSFSNSSPVSGASRGRGGDIMDPAAWDMSRLVGNPVMRYPQAHRLWAGPSVQERSVDGRLLRCTGTGARECIYWQEPVAFEQRGGGGVGVAVRITTDQNCNSALLCTLPTAGAGHGGGGGELECSKYAGVPGFGNVRGWVVYDRASDLYWAVNNFNIDTTSGGTGKSFLRLGQRCFNQRGNVGLFYSGDGHNWVLAKVLTRANSNVLSLHYVSCTVAGEDLVCVGRTNGELGAGGGGAGAGEADIVAGNARNHHVSRMVVSWRVPSFRALQH